MSITLEKITQASWSDGTRDKRYSVTLEWCGYETPRYVVRFCGEWISCHRGKTAAWNAAQAHKDNRTN